MGAAEPPGPAEVCVDAGEASARAAAGIDVVLVLVEGVALADRPDGPGRVAVFVGDPGLASDRDAAIAMGAELFGI